MSVCTVGEACGSRNPSRFHIHQKEKGAVKDQAASDTDTAVSSALDAVQSSGLTWSREHDFKLSTVSVKSQKVHKIVETYPFLDQNSS